MRDLILALKKSACLDNKRAKEVAMAVLSVFEEQLYWGKGIDLGFMSIDAKIKKPSTVRSNLSHSRGVYLIGERISWKIRFSPAWVKRRKPVWAKDRI